MALEVETQKEIMNLPLLDIEGLKNVKQEKLPVEEKNSLNLKFFGFTKSIDPETRIVEAIVSTENIDRMNEIVSMDAFEKSIHDYLSMNPIVLGFHFYEGPPVGRCLDLKIVGDSLLAKIQFSKQANDIWELYRDGYMRAFSIGFLINDYEYVEIENQKGVVDKIRKITDLELLEISVVSVPANRQALVIAKQKGLLENEEKTVEGDIMKEDEIKNLQEEEKQEMNTSLEKARKIHNLVDKILNLFEDENVSDDIIRPAMFEASKLFMLDWEASSLENEYEDFVDDAPERKEVRKDDVANDEETNDNQEADIKLFFEERIDKTQEFFRNKLEMLDKMNNELSVFTGNKK